MNIIKIPPSMLSSRHRGKPVMEPFSGCWIAGGSVRRMVAGMKQDSDVDLFFKSQSALDSAVDEMTKTGFRQTRKFGKLVEYRRDSVLVQVIGWSFYESVETLLDSFDFTICQFAYDGTDVFASDAALVDLSRMALVAHKIQFPLATMRRMHKYIAGGFHACHGTYRAIVDACRTAEESALGVRYID